LILLKILIELPFVNNHQLTGGLLKSGHMGAVYSLDFSADSSVLASGGADCTVRVWNVKRSDPSGAVVVGEDGGVAASDNPANVVVSLFRTKRTPIYRVRFTPRNLLLTAGPFTPFSAPTNPGN
jgi:transcription initiation factor TFIID subunit 5